MVLSIKSTTKRKMNPITDFIFTATWIALFVLAIRSIVRGWSISSQMNNKTYIDEGTRYVTKVQHPEMVDVIQGDELMVVNFNRKDKDPLYESLENRIDELEEEDDDGDIVVRT